MKKFLAVLFILSVLMSACKKQQRPEEPPPSVTVVKVAKGDVAATTELIGQAKAYDEVDLVARVQGFLEKISFKEGSAVTKGQVLFKIEQEQYAAQVKASEALLMRMQATLANAEADFNRQKKLLESNVAAQKDFDKANAYYLESKAGVLAAEASLEQAKLNLGYTTITAPFDGRIGFFTYSEGNLVGPNSKRLANVVKFDPIRIQFNMSEVDLVEMQLNRTIKQDNSERDKYTILIQFQNGALYDKEGKISFADNKVNSSTGTILLEALFPNPDRIVAPGMYVKVLIREKDKTPALLIPQSSIQESQLGKFVLTVGADGKVAQKTIKTGVKIGPSIQVTEGLQAGEMVIVEGLQKVRFDTAVRAVVDETYVFDKEDVK